MRSEDQFNPLAAKYAASPVHANGPSLPVLLEVAAPTAQEVALDVATGTGHTALTLAPYLQHVTGIDRAEKMLAEARRLAREKGYPNAEFQLGDAEAIPFEDASFDLVTARHAPHHFTDATAFLRQVRRVLRPEGRFVMVDQISPTEEVAPWIHFWEQTRDPSHFRQRTVAEWQAMAAEVGLSAELHTIVPYRMTYAWWTAQANCSADQLAQLDAHARAASPAVVEAFKLEFEETGAPLAFSSPMAVILFRPLV